MNSGRRRTLTHIFQLMGVVAMGGFAWSAYIAQAKENPLFLYPPGARDNFEATCIRCGFCVQACPYYTLKLSTNGVKGLPVFIPREVPCFMCDDVPCVRVCPTDALDKKSLGFDGKNANSIDIKKARMGVAIIDTLNCIAYSGIQCDACVRACPLIDKAIYLEYRSNERTGKHSMILPMVANDVCTGCGKCEKACVTEITSIRVLPRKEVLGKMGTNYVKGWDEQDELRLKDVKTKDGQQDVDSVIDYLNKEDLL